MVDISDKKKNTFLDEYIHLLIHLDSSQVVLHAVGLDCVITAFYRLSLIMDTYG